MACRGVGAAARTDGIAGFPLVRPALRSLPDEGWLVARTAGLLLLASAVWMPASQGWLTASRSGVAAVAASLVVLSAWAAWVQREALARWWHVRRTLLFIEEALFWSAFVGFVLIRRLNPDLWHPQFGGREADGRRVYCWRRCAVSRFLH